MPPPEPGRVCRLPLRLVAGAGPGPVAAAPEMRRRGPASSPAAPGVRGRTVGGLSQAVDRLLRELPQSPPLHLEPGDATVHDGMTIHSAGANQTADPRWSYVVQYFVADALYTGAMNRQTDRVAHLAVGKPLCDCHFPVAGVPRQPLG